MEQNVIYFGKSEIYEKIRELGGHWDDNKKRPIVCLIESIQYKGLYWAIPMGKWNHRKPADKERIQSFLNRPDYDLRSCYYHLGKTDTMSIFFISKVFPITQKYIDREYKSSYTGEKYTIKNKKLLKALNDKLDRILAFEAPRKNYFEQHITDIKNYLVEELSKQSVQQLPEVATEALDTTVTKKLLNEIHKPKEETASENEVHNNQKK